MDGRDVPSVIIRITFFTGCTESAVRFWALATGFAVKVRQSIANSRNSFGVLFIVSKDLELCGLCGFSIGG